MKFLSVLIVILGVYLVKDVNAKPNPTVQSIVKANTPENRKICSMWQCGIMLMWNFVTVERLRNLKETDLAEELSGQFQGDIIITEEQLQETADNLKSGSKTGLRDSKYRWKDNIVPYHIMQPFFSKLIMWSLVELGFNPLCLVM